MSGGEHCDLALAVELRSGGRGGGRRSRAGIKSNNPYLASGTKNIRIFGRFILIPLFHTFSALGCGWLLSHVNQPILAEFAKQYLLSIFLSFQPKLALSVLSAKKFTLLAETFANA